MDKYQVALQAILSCNSLAAAHMIAQEALRKSDDSFWSPRDQVEVQKPRWNWDMPGNQLHAFDMVGLDANDYNGLKSPWPSSDDDDEDVTSGHISD